MTLAQRKTRIKLCERIIGLTPLEINLRMPIFCRNPSRTRSRSACKHSRYDARVRDFALEKHKLPVYAAPPRAMPAVRTTRAGTCRKNTSPPFSKRRPACARQAQPENEDAARHAGRRLAVGVAAPCSARMRSRPHGRDRMPPTRGPGPSTTPCRWWRRS